MSTDPLPIAFLLSGDGSTLQNFIDQRERGELDVDIKVVISSQPEAGGLRRAQRAGIETVVVPRSGHTQDSFSREITQSVQQFAAELVCMGGFLSMWIIPPQYEGKVMNIHPALLPAFGGKGYYGSRVYQAVLDAGCKVTGCTVHFADNVYDHGPIILQQAVAIAENDTVQTLSKRVREAERTVYPQAVRLFASGRLRIDGRRVRILDG